MLFSKFNEIISNYMLKFSLNSNNLVVLMHPRAINHINMIKLPEVYMKKEP